MKKHFLFWALLLSCTLPTIVWSGEVLVWSVEVDGIYYECRGGDSVSVVYVSLKDSRSITIPATIEYYGTSYRVTSIRDFAFENCFNLTEIIIPNTITTIDWGVFRDCRSNLTTPIYNEHIFAFLPTSYEGAYTIPNGIKSIIGGAFSGCSNLTSITIPESVTSIGSYAFHGCSSLTSITIPEGVTTIDYQTFSDCSSLADITIPNSVTSIESEAFSGCSSLSEIILPNSVTSIGFNVFYNCSNLTTPVYNEHVFAFLPTSYVGAYVVPNGIKLVAGGAFNECSSLTSVIIPESVTSIGGGSTFSECSSLTDVTLSNNITSIGEWAFSGCSSLTAITIPNSVTTIGQCAFVGCSSLTTITFSNSVVTISYDAFQYCSSVETITVESGNPTYHSTNNCLIETETKTLVMGCKNSIIPDDGSVTTIGFSAFHDCSGLTSITIPNGVTSIEGGAFSDCSNLTAITISNSVVTIDYWAFQHCSSVETITVESGNPTYHSTNNCLIETATKTLVIGCKNSIIPDDGSVTSIGEAAFFDCSGLTSITIPNGVTSIGERAFYYCSSLTSITIPNSVTFIGNVAFCNCSNLTAITIPKNVTSIGENVFCGCSNLTEITIPNSVTTIGTEAFSGCFGLTEITCWATTPPAINDEYTFWDVDHSIPLYVPAESIETYKAAAYWNEFTNIQAIVSPFDSLTLRVDEIALYPNEKYFLNIVVEPNDVDKSTLIWTSSDTNIATVDSTGFVTAHAVGTAQIIVSTPDKALSDTCEVIVLDESQEPSDDVVVDPNDQSVNIIWTPVDGAALYVFVVFADETQQTKICTLTFDAHGYLTNIHFAQKKPAANPESHPFNFTVTGLEENTTYGFTMSSYNEEETLITSKAGQFTTTSGTTTTVETPYIASPNEIRKVFENGTIYILKPNGERYTIDGRKVE